MNSCHNEVQRRRIWVQLSAGTKDAGLVCRRCGITRLTLRLWWRRFETQGEPIDETPFGLGTDRPGIKSIPTDETRSITFFIVRIERDRWIKHERSATLDGGGGIKVSVPPGVPVEETSPVNFLFLENIGHDPLPKHPALIRFIYGLLAARDEK